MLSIERMILKLPAGYETRAGAIARLVAHELAKTPVSESRSLGRVAVPEVQTRPGESDRQLAARIAAAIHGQAAAAQPQ